MSHCRLPRALAVLPLLLGMGCLAELSDPMGRQRALENAQLHYTQLVRWGDLDRAREYVHPEALEEFNRHVEAFAGLRITDYEIGRLEFDGEPGTASVRVTYRGYSETAFLEKPIRELQSWVRLGRSSVWRVRPELGEIVGALREPGS